MRPRSRPRRSRSRSFSRRSVRRARSFLRAREPPRASRGAAPRRGAARRRAQRSPAAILWGVDERTMKTLAGRSQADILRPMRVLVIEDYMPLRIALDRGIREAGYAVDCA